MLHMNWTLRCFMQTDSHKKEETRSKKDPSAPLGMTIREYGLSHIPFHTAAEPTSAPSGHLLPKEGGRIHTIPRRKSLPRVGKVTSIASRIGFQGNVREQLSQACDLREYPSAAHLTFPFISSRRDCPCGADLSSTFDAPLLQGAAQRSCKSAVYENTASPLLCTIAFPAWGRWRA